MIPEEYFQRLLEMLRIKRIDYLHDAMTAESEGESTEDILRLLAKANAISETIEEFDSLHNLVTEKQNEDS